MIVNPSLQFSLLLMPLGHETLLGLINLVYLYLKSFLRA